MESNLITSHISFNSNESILKLCNAFFKTKKIKISYLNVIQKHNDGTVSYLCSHRDWLLHYFSKSYPSIGAFEQNSFLANWRYILWDSLDKMDPILKDSKAMLGIETGITIIEKFEYGTRFYNIGSCDKNPAIVNDYINYLADLNEFIYIFKQQMHSILQQAYKTRFILPIKVSKNYKIVTDNQPLADAKDKASINIEGRLYIDKSKNLYLSEREVECIDWYVKGKTAPEIAEICGISKRTVESHIENAKVKLGCYSLFQLGYVIAMLKFKNYGYIPQLPTAP